MKRRIVLVVLSSLAASVFASAGASAQTVLVDGSVEKIDQAAAKITLNHGPIKNLDMDAMKMVFRVKDPEMLKGLKVGQRIKFEADRVNGQITVTRIEPGEGTTQKKKGR
ncbi:RND transporter [Afipia sp. P52-10]|uniref:copper-binding protein n=1 Tax=Afipia sp. P52-10 TaxID=1429916 RepID=UPI0003DF1AAB|nr:copper-binding protein [Afipia sp. P52-10]ETR76220.1 RND transporter [Afipia sp. P52-10]